MEHGVRVDVNCNMRTLLISPVIVIILEIMLPSRLAGLFDWDVSNNLLQLLFMQIKDTMAFVGTDVGEEFPSTIVAIVCVVAVLIIIAAVVAGIICLVLR